MKETILITGAGPNGITGKLIKERLKNKFEVLAPSSKDLDLTNDGMVDNFFASNQIDYVIHCATFRPLYNTTSHFVDDVLESNLRMYFLLAKHSDDYKKMFYFGSGAEFGKFREIVNVREDKFGEVVPKDAYGLGKYIMNEHCLHSNNIYNFRLFGTISPFERYTKNVISNMCVKAMCGFPINLRQDCRFSFIDMDDVTDILNQAIHMDLKYHDYNMVGCQSYLLSELAQVIAGLSRTNVPIQFVNKGLNLEYTGSCKRMNQEFNPPQYIGGKFNSQSI